MTQVRKVVINTCFGGFGLSKEARALYAQRKGLEPEDVSLWDIPRDDYDLVTIVEQLGKKANGEYAILKVVEIPADVEWEIAEYDGAEHVAEVHRTWY